MARVSTPRGAAPLPQAGTARRGAPTHRRWRRARSNSSVLLLLLLGLFTATSALATRTEVHVIDDYAGFAKGELEGTSLAPDGSVRLGPVVEQIVKDLPGPVLALARGGDGLLYAATAAPGRIWRLAPGKEPELFADMKKPLVTALLPVGRGQLVALTAPDGGAHFLSLDKKREPRVVEASGVKMLLGGAALGDTIYAVGGGDEGVLLRLKPGASSFETLAKVAEKHLRAIAVEGRGQRSPRVVVGGGDDGVVYSWEGERLRALVDAASSEVTSLVIDRKGRVYAALVDSDGKLSAGATDRDEEEDDGKGEKKPRKVKSAEVLRLDPSGRVEVLWQSKSHGAYALTLSRGRLLLGTGARGRIYDVDPDGKRPAGVLARSEGHDEVTVLLSQRDGSVIAGTAHGGGVLSVSSKLREKGAYLSDALDAGSIARYGAVRVDARTPSGAEVRVRLRTGNTSEPDDTWSAFSSPLITGGVPNAPLGRYAQLRFELSRGTGGDPAVSAARLSYLEDNRPPEVSRVEALMPGWRVTLSEREIVDSRSVTFSEKPFSSYLERAGSRLPKLHERPSGKQVWSPGWRTLYAWVEDPDKDSVRYRFLLGRVDSSGAVSEWRAVKEWSEEPFYSFEAARLADGRYRVRVEVDDSPTNGTLRALPGDGVSPVFRIAHARPRFVDAQASAVQGGYRARFSLEAELPLAGVRCSAGGDEWLPVDAADGIVDTERERFDVTLPGRDLFSSVSCEAIDEAGNQARIDLPVGR